MDFEVLKQIIEEWKINQNLLGSKMGMSRGAFNNKLQERIPHKFTPIEIKKLKEILIQLRNDLKKIK